MQVGIGVVPMSQMVGFDELREDARYAEELGVDAVWLVDQLWVDRSMPEIEILEPWAALAGLGACTERIRLGTAVTNAALRHPTSLARTVLATDRISHGRIDLGMGAGWSSEELAALGLEVLETVDHLARLQEVVQVLAAALTGEAVRHAGPRFAVDDVTFRPAPAQRPRPPIWVAAQGRQALRIAVEDADAVMTFGGTAQDEEAALAAFARRMQRLDELCEDVGRDPASVRRCYFMGGTAEPWFASAEATADWIGRYAEAGATDVTLYLSHPGAEFAEALTDAGRMMTREQLEVLAAEVAPRFRD